MDVNMSAAEDPRVRAMELVGRFGRLQVLIDEFLAAQFFKEKVPASADLVHRLAIKRIHDADRPSLVLAIAEDYRSDADLDCFAGCYGEVRTARNTLAHHAVQVVDDETGDLLIGNLVAADMERFTINELNRLVWISKWLEAQVMYIRSQQTHTMYLGDVEIKAVRPPRKPTDWDGTWYVPV